MRTKKFWIHIPALSPTSEPHGFTFSVCFVLCLCIWLAESSLLRAGFTPVTAHGLLTAVASLVCGAWASSNYGARASLLHKHRDLPGLGTEHPLHWQVRCLNHGITRIVDLDPF